MHRIMSIDYGDARVGIALTDPLQIAASGYATLKNSDTLMEEIAKICREKVVLQIVVGIPYDNNNNLGSSAKKIVDFTNRLDLFLKESGYEIEIYGEDERYTTIEAKETLKELKVKNKRQKEVIDQIAAAKTLSSFMNNRHKHRLN